MKRACLFLLLFILFSVNVQAIGISPSKITINFEPNLQETYTFYAFNNREHPIYIQPYVGGGLEKYIEIINPEPVEVDPRGAVAFKFALRLPPSLNEPGTHKTYIGVTEVPGELGDSGSIVAVTSAKAILEIKVPFPGKYAKADLIVENVNVGESADFKVTVENLGEQSISSARATVALQEGDVVVKEIYSIAQPVPRKTSVTFPVKVNTEGLKGGEYQALAIVDYDGFTATDEELFRLGDLDVELTKYTEEFEINKINKWEIWIQSRWNKKIDLLYVEAKVIQNNQEIDISARTPTISLDPWQEQRLITYWDTSGFAIGDYDALIRVYYHNKTEDNPIKIKISSVKSEGIRIQLPLILKGVSIQVVMLAIIILILIIDMIWFILIYKKSGKKEIKIKDAKKK